jgi:hypothetical protein
VFPRIALREQDQQVPIFSVHVGKGLLHAKAPVHVGFPTARSDVDLGIEILLAGLIIEFLPFGKPVELVFAGSQELSG